MNRVVLEEHELVGENEYRLQGEKFLHIINHLKKNKNDLLKICVLNHGIGDARLIIKAEDHCLLKIESLAEGVRGKINLVIGLSRPPTMRKILEHGCGLGVKHFYFLNCELSENSFRQSKELESSTIEKRLKDGLAQSGTYFKLPLFSFHQRLEEFTSWEKKGVVLHQSQEASWLSKEDCQGDEIFLFIGPERGWSDRELNWFSLNQIKMRTVSKSILRVETAVFVSLGQVALLSNE